MNIIAGKYRGLNLFFPKDKKNIRPTQNRVRESVFNILQSVITDSLFLDLYSGTGANGLEALARGASRVILVDKNAEYLKRNALLIKDPADRDRISIRQTLVAAFLAKTELRFDIVFLDPPWDLPLELNLALDLLAQRSLLQPDGVIICEHKRNYALKVPLPFCSTGVYNYGDTYLTRLALKKDS